MTLKEAELNSLVRCTFGNAYFRSWSPFVNLRILSIELCVLIKRLTELFLKRFET